MSDSPVFCGVIGGYTIFGLEHASYLCFAQVHSMCFGN